MLLRGMQEGNMDILGNMGEIGEMGEMGGMGLMEPMGVIFRRLGGRSEKPRLALRRNGVPRSPGGNLVEIRAWP